MIGLVDEYEKMYRLEGRLWWYRALHERVCTAIRHHFGERRDVAILDVGCGTGGLLNYLQKCGYTKLNGIDGSTDAVAFCQERSLPVVLINLNNLAQYEPDTRYDVIVCNDVFCYFDNPAIARILFELALRLKPNGLLISNNNAFNAFRGQHDVAVGSIQRFVLSDFERFASGAGLTIKKSTYWSFVLSPMILLMRQWQNWQLKLGWQKPEDVQSDVYLPSTWLNEALYKLVRIEENLLPRTPFGSSLFLILNPDRAD
ncbi:class I SAM-dependent methyltransferase [Spirosoma sp. SC4-14]|uniref:class I SAM-dependent DNA methyltransferase n=1 Tax=Spirosoma sp. SC4-14 TaxID=3128900 RepID=UPI0030CE1CC0